MPAAKAGAAPKKKRAPKAAAAVEAEVVAVAPVPEEAAASDGQSHIILQLPIQASRVEEITKGAAGRSELQDPSPWAPWAIPYMPCLDAGGAEAVDESIVSGTSGGGDGAEAGCPACFWCCHAVPSRKHGMPLDYDPAHRMFTVYGVFCSLQCAAAHNMATHVGSDRMWDVHAWIQMLAKMQGLTLPVRPAPSRYVLKLFGGPLDIDDFRAAHHSPCRTVVLNVPPLVSVQGQTEVVNTSFLANDGKVKLSRRKAIVDPHKTLETKMNLSYGAAH